MVGTSPTMTTQVRSERVTTLGSRPLGPLSVPSSRTPHASEPMAPQASDVRADLVGARESQPPTPLATTGSHTKTVEVARIAPMRIHDHQSLPACMATDAALVFLLVSALRRRALGMVHLLV